MRLLCCLDMASAPSSSVSVECVNMGKLTKGEGSGRYVCSVLSCASKAPRVLTGFLASTVNPSHSSLFAYACHGRRNLIKPFKSWSSSTCRPCGCAKTDLTKQHEETASLEAETETDTEETFQVLTAVKTKYNDILIVDTPKSRMLLLDSTHNVHSVLQKGDEKWTGSYWDEFASLPPIVPEGLIAIYGLGGGTAAHLMLDMWPSLQLEGWEIDQILIDKAREYFGLSNLERCNKFGGGLQVHIDDAFSPLQHLPAGYADNLYSGIIVDLFSDGKVLSQLQEVETWLELSDRLMPGGRLMVNCGGVSESSIDGKLHHLSVDDIRIQNSTINALAKAFPGQVNWKRMPEIQGENYLALTGPLPDLTQWSALVPSCLSEAVKQWKPCRPLHS